MRLYHKGTTARASEMHHGRDRRCVPASMPRRNTNILEQAIQIRLVCRAASYSAMTA